MKFTVKRTKWSTNRIEGRKNGFLFSIAPTNEGGYYVTADHAKKDIRYNSLWTGTRFDTEDDAKEWCELFDHKNYDCLGNDV